MKVDEALKRFRAEFKLSQREVAATLGILPQAYARYESGKYVPRADDITKLSKAFGVSTDYLLGVSDNPAFTDDNLLAALKSCRQTLNAVLEKRGVTHGE